MAQYFVSELKEDLKGEASYDLLVLKELISSMTVSCASLGLPTRCKCHSWPTIHRPPFASSLVCIPSLLQCLPASKPACSTEAHKMSKSSLSIQAVL